MILNVSGIIMGYRLRRRRGDRRYSLSKQTRRYAYAFAWLVIAIIVLTSSGLLASFLPNANPVIVIPGEARTMIEIPVVTIGQIILGFLGLFALFRFINLIGIRI